MSKRLERNKSLRNFLTSLISEDKYMYLTLDSIRCWIPFILDDWKDEPENYKDYHLTQDELRQLHNKLTNI